MIADWGRRAEAAHGGGARIAFLSDGGSDDSRVQPGHERAMARALQRQGHDVVWLKPAPAASNAVSRAFALALCRLCGKAASLRRLRPDWIITSHGSAELAELASNVPLVYCAGADSGTDPVEALAVRNASLCTYSSRVAAESAIRNYGVDPSRVSVIPFGASLDVPERGELPEKRVGDTLRLLFIGEDFEREGGPLAFDALVCLQERDLKASLLVVGCSPPASFRNAALTVFPRLDTSTAEGRMFFAEIYSRSHFLLLPGPMPAFAGALNEANGYGVPAIVAECGAPAEAVADGVNGLRLPLPARGGEYAAAIAELWADRARYVSLSHSSRESYERQGNWDAWAAELCRRVAEALPPCTVRAGDGVLR